MPSFYLALLLVLVFAINFEILSNSRTSHSVPDDGSFALLFRLCLAFSFTNIYNLIWWNWKFNFIY